MRVGIYYDFSFPPRLERAAFWTCFLEQVRAADEMGFDDVWFAERHFADDAPGQAQILAAYLAKSTRVLRIGGFKVCPLDNPVRLAEDAAVLDLLSGGRLNFGAGVGDQPAAYRARGVPWEEREARLWEGLDLVRHAWTSDEFHHLGRRYQFPGHLQARTKAAYQRRMHHGRHVPQWERGAVVVDYLAVTPKPLQVPHPPFFVLGTTPGLVRATGRRGWSCVLPAALGREELIQEARRYRRAMNAAGRARGEAQIACICDIAFTDGAAGRRRKPFICGSAEEIVEQLKRLQNDTDLQHLIWRIPFPQLDHTQVLQNLNRFAREVQPLLQS